MKYRQGRERKRGEKHFLFPMQETEAKTQNGGNISKRKAEAGSFSLSPCSCNSFLKEMGGD
jgi:hypothetical protein